MQRQRTHDVVSGWQYRLTSAIGTAVITVLAVFVANHSAVQHLVSWVPVLNRLPEDVLSNGDLVIAMMTVLLIVLVALVPLYKPRPRRVLDVVTEIQRRIVLSAFALATIGYFDYTFKLPRITLVLTTAGLLVLLPAWHILIRRQRGTTKRGIIVGDDQESIADLLGAAELPILGYVSLTNPYFENTPFQSASPRYADGGSVSLVPKPHNLEYLGGISRLDDILVSNDVDTVILAFSQSDRQEFFGILDTCYSNGVAAKVHHELGESVLTSGSPQYNELVDIDLEPWDWQDRMIKRLFDVAFATVGLVVLSPLVLLIAIAIKLDSPGPVIYSQERTSTFGCTFTVYKFRSMINNAEAKTGATISDEDAGGVDSRVTRVGHILRRTHLDELPQLWSIFIGDMSVVGPRPERPEIDREITADTIGWKRRWFVKPGLTGLAQINNVTGHDPDRKLQFDTEYIRRQSTWFDVKIVIRQIYEVISDVIK